MSTVIQFPRSTARAHAAAAAVSAAAIRYGHNRPMAASYAEAARRMVSNGHTAGSVIASVKRKARSEATKPPAA